MNNMHGFNTVRKIFASVELSEYKAKKFNSFNEVTNAIIEDIEPEIGREFKGDGAVGNADCQMNDYADVTIFENKGERFIHLAMTFLEFFDTDEDGDFRNGSDFDQTCDFTDEQKQTIREFCGF